VDLSATPPKALAEVLTRRGLEVEAIEAQGAAFDKVVTARILERAKHPDSDRLSLCSVSIGAGEPLAIVCGAQNMKAGDIVALAQIGAHLPNGMKIGQGKIRGVVSNGMLCSEQELKLAETSEGILILPSGTPLGLPLAEFLGRDDTILELKLTANRGDCLSHFGLAREVAAALGQSPKAPQPKLLDFKGSPIAVHLDAGESAPQFYGCLIEGVKVGPSPAWLVKRLEAVGSRSINNVVDATNLAMLELGHPMHAYDANRIAGQQLRVRLAKDGEKLPLLDGAEVTLAGTELVIADGEKAVGLAGVMGGGNSEVQDGSTRLFLECAEFAPGLVRRAASRHVRRTDAAQRFEKGIDPEGLPRAISRLAQLVIELAGGKVTGSVVARTPGAVSRKLRTVVLDPTYLPSFLGMSVTGEQAEKIFRDLDCQVDKTTLEWTVTSPSYRLDLNRREDLAEEIARTLGYDAIPATLPSLSSNPTSIKAASGAQSSALIDRAKDLLVQSGLSETLNYSFTSKSWLAKFGMAPHLSVTNPLSEEHEAMVPSLLPGLIQSALGNWHKHFGSEALPIRLFELRPVFGVANAGAPIQASGEMETGVVESWKLSFAVSGPRFVGGLRNEQGEVDFFDVKALVENLLAGLDTRGTRIQPISGSRALDTPLAKLFHPGQSAEILAGKDSAGFFGLIHPGKAKELKLRAPLWIGELDWKVLSQLSPAASDPRSYRAWSEFPSIERDFALLVRSDISADKIVQVATKAGKPLAKVVRVFDIYRGSQVQEGMTSVAVRVIFYEDTRSLQESEAEAASNQILNAWKKDLGIELRS
jgi:phenylalanyl-tRNA synthetase beta chain